MRIANILHTDTLGLIWNGSEFVICWWENPEIRLQRVRADGTLIGSASSPATGHSPRLILAGDGLLLAFVDAGKSYMLRLSHDGQPRGAPEELSGSTGAIPAWNGRTEAYLQSTEGILQAGFRAPGSPFGEGRHGDLGGDGDAAGGPSAPSVAPGVGLGGHG